jgi:hypothetical protein
MLEVQHLLKVEFLVLDDVEALWQRLTSDLVNKKLVWEVLKFLVQRVPHLLVLDAHLSPFALHFIQELRPQDKITLIVNKYQGGQGHIIYLYDPQEDVLNRAITTVKAGGTVYLAFNGKKTARKMFKSLQKQCVEAKALYISADNNGDANVQEFFAHANEEAKKYHYIIATPAVCAGVSLDEVTFDMVGGIFSHMVNTPQEAFQALARVRTATEWHVWVSDRKNALPTDSATIEAKWKESPRHDRQLMTLNMDGSLGCTDELYEELYLAITQRTNRAKNDYLSNFLELAYEDGYKVQWVSQLPPPEQVVAKEIYKEGSLAEHQEYIEMRADAVELTKQEVVEKEQQYQHTFEETAAIDKFRIKEYYCLENPTREDLLQVIEEDNRGTLRKQVEEMENTLASDEELKEKYEQQQDKFRPDQECFALRRELYRMLLSILGIGTDLTSEGHKYSAQSAAVTGFIEWVISNSGTLRGIVNIPPVERLRQDPLRFVGKLLRKVGLKQKRTGRHNKGEYMINEGVLARMKEIIAKRRRRREEEGGTCVKGALTGGGTLVGINRSILASVPGEGTNGTLTGGGTLVGINRSILASVPGEGKIPLGNRCCDNISDKNMCSGQNMCSGG